MEEWEVVDIPTHRLKGAKWVATVVEIRNNATGDVREHRDDSIMEDGETEPSSFMWEDGNCACDCNRRLFFARSAGEDEDWESECGHGAFSVRVRNKRSGRVFYSEFDA
jgi:hypothetical protein